MRKPRNTRAEAPIDGVDEEVLSPNDKSLYRAVVARISYLSQDRGDLQFASKDCSRKMSGPAPDDFTAVKRFCEVLYPRAASGDLVQVARRPEPPVRLRGQQLGRMP